jgi:hypothetical protein
MPGFLERLREPVEDWMRRFALLGGWCWLMACSPQPKCTYLDCTQNIAQACGQLQAVGQACGKPSSQSSLGSCQDDLETDCSEADSNGLANATGCFGTSTACAGAGKSIQACFAAQSLSSGCRSAAQAQIGNFLPAGD